MSLLIITPDDKVRIRAMLTEARERYHPWAVLQDGALLTDNLTLTLDDRKPGFERPPSLFIELGHFTAGISFEEQPDGIFKHLSISVGDGRLLPNVRAVAMLCEEFGFKDFPPAEGGIWVEEFEPKCYAVNVLELVEPAEQGAMQ